MPVLSICFWEAIKVNCQALIKNVSGGKTVMIKTEIKKISNYKKELSITMDKADLEPIREAQAKRVQKEVQFPGFRKGKAPMGMVKKNYADAVEAYTLEAALDESLQKSVIENQIQVVGTPEAKKVDFNDNGGQRRTSQSQVLNESGR